MKLLDKTQKGVTLIELMIVIGMIGIFAAVAIPTYTNYLKRGKVSEAVELLGGLKTSAEEYYTSKGYFPSTVTVLTDKLSGKYTTNLKVSAGGGTDATTFTIAFRTDDTVLSAYVMALSYDPTTKLWYCDAARTGNATTMPAKYLPSTCK
jgi:type IV pilus assembly protein PilA